MLMRSYIPLFTRVHTFDETVIPKTFSNPVLTSPPEVQRHAEEHRVPAAVEAAAGSAGRDVWPGHAPRPELARDLLWSAPLDMQDQLNF